MTRRYIIQGITDEVTVCDCCGKVDLASTVCFLDNETGDLVYFGSTCAKRNTGATIAQHTTARREIEAAARAAALNTPEGRALAALRAKLHKEGMKPGRDFRDATAAESAAFKAVEAEMIAQALAAA